MTRSLATLLTQAIVSLLLTGCASNEPLQMYTGNRLPAKAEALLTGSKDAGRPTMIMAVDGKSTQAFFLGVPLGLAPPNQIAVLPGQHRLAVVAGVGGLFTRVELDLDARAGQVYRLEDGAEGYGIKVWIEEVQTDKQGE